MRTVVLAGPYRLLISANPVVVPHGFALALRSTISERRTGAPIGPATVRLVVRSTGDGLMHIHQMAGFDGQYFTNVPIPNPDTWRSLHYTLEITGPLGVAVARYIPPDLFDEWLVEPLVLAAAALAIALFGQGFIRLRRRGRRDHATFGRAGLFLLGLSVMVAPLISPLDPIGDHYLLSAHMLQHLCIGDAGPALIVLSLRGPLVFFVLPRAMMRAVGRAAWLRQAAAWVVRPRVVLTVWALAYGGWHVPVAYDYAATHQWVHDGEHASFVLAGFLLWSLLIDPAGHRRFSRGRRLGVAAAVFAMGTVIADVLMFSFHPLYPLYALQPERLFSLSALRDQQLAGLLMTVEQIATLGTFAAVLLVPVLRARARHPAFVSGLEPSV
jgi:cytochrome c oxidase assembly factor CtaG